MYKIVILLCLFLVSSAWGNNKVCSGVDTHCCGVDDCSTRQLMLDKQAQTMWNVVWNLFFSPKTNLFYDFVSSYEVGTQFNHLPTKQEALACFPNTSGTGTGMEDSMILAGLVLDAIIYKYDIHKDSSLKQYADKVLDGIVLCATIHNSQGFIARSVSALDGKTAYIGSSRDQFTQAIYGMWRYYNSPLCDDIAKVKIKRVMFDVGERMLKYMTAEHNYDYGLADGRKCPVGLSKMWNVMPHEAARLPMFYAVAWQTTGDDRFFKEYRKFIKPAIEQSKNFGKGNPGWADMQMMMSLVLLCEMENDVAIKNDIKNIMAKLGKLDNGKCVSRCQRFFKVAKDFDMSMLPPDWRRPVSWKFRKGVPHYFTPDWGDYHKVWYAGRGVGEFGWSAIHCGISKDAVRKIEDVILASDYKKTSSCSIIYHLACYWALKNLQQ
ncbi:MAG: hypothetical protein E7035_08300 [Verrucomicrobiaceae bacterium]|nr:hypothetical protein [Verrucomicrobiaceae bacterium]